MKFQTEQKYFVMHISERKNHEVVRLKSSDLDPILPPMIFLKTLCFTRKFLEQNTDQNHQN